METLAIKAMPEYKIAGEGLVVARFATFGVLDSDRDITMPGAFEEGKTIPIGAWNHGRESLPAGKGVIRQTEEAAFIDGELFLDTPQGSAMFSTLKNLGPIAEWSYVYQPAKWSMSGEGDVRILEKIDVFQVDPVMKGAGVDTRTEDIKAAPGEWRMWLEGGRESSTILIALDEAIETLKGKAIGAADIAWIKEVQTRAESLTSMIPIERPSRKAVAEALMLLATLEARAKA